MDKRYLTALTALLLSASQYPPARAQNDKVAAPSATVTQEASADKASAEQETSSVEKTSAKQEDSSAEPTSAKQETTPQAAKQEERPAAEKASGQAATQKTDNKSTGRDSTAQSTDNTSTTRPHVTLALGGGGTKCVTEIGVLRVFEANHIPIDYIVGTSSGATIGSLYCAGVPLNEIEKMYHDATIQKVMVPNMVPRMLLKPLEKLASPLKGEKPAAGLTDGAAFRDFLTKRLPANFKGFKIPFAAVATNLSDGQTYMLKEGDPAQAVLASNAFPGLFRPVKINGKLYVDGGVKANMPANCAKATGADYVIAVMSDETVSKQPNEKFTSIKSVMGRVTDIMLADADKHKIKDCDVVIIPRIQEIPFMTKDPKDIEAAEKAGEVAANSSLHNIQDLLSKNKAASLPQQQ